VTIYTDRLNIKILYVAHSMYAFTRFCPIQFILLTAIIPTYSINRLIFLMGDGVFSGRYELNNYIRV
jgi:hypothetical protein